MKIVMGIMIIQLFGNALAAHGDSTTLVPRTNEITISGYIVDNNCAAGKKKEEMNAFVNSHPKSCAVTQKNADSGYSIETAGGDLQKFDRASSKKIEAFLKKSDSSLRVVIKAKKSANQLTLISIDNG